MIPDERLKELLSNIELEIKTRDPHLLGSFPVEAYMASIDRYPKYAGLKYRSDDVEKCCDAIVRNTGVDILEAYHKLILIRLIDSSQKKIRQLNLPDEVKNDYRKDFNRILSQMENGQDPKGYYLYTNDRFYKDLSLCCLRLFPVGARKYELSFFPIKRFLRKGYGQLVKLLIYLTLETRGIAPFLTGHYDTEDPDFMGEFNLKGFMHAYRIVAKVMKMNSDIKGYFGINWINDPQIERISPGLAYIRYMNIACGCRYFYLGANDSSIKNATKKSPTRRRLYREGKYLPENYAFVFSRKRLLGWADQQKWYW